MESEPLIKFPFVSVLATGKHTEIVLTRGVGLHTILGMTIDLAVGQCLDKVYNNFRHYNYIYKDKEHIQNFVNEYNSKT